MMGPKKEMDDMSGLSSAFTSLAPEHYEKLQGLIADLPTSTTATPTDKEARNIPFYVAEKAQEKFEEILDLYQEQPHLLDSKLQAMLDPLLRFVRNAAQAKGHETAVQDPLVRFSFRFIQHLSKVRGYKVMLRHLPHEVGDLEPVLGLGESVETGGEFWAHRSVLLLWLLILVKMPFQLSRFDTPDRPPIAHRLLALARSHLDSSENCRVIATRLLATLITRHDLKKDLLRASLESLVGDLGSIDSLDLKACFHRTAGLAAVIAAILKVGEREDLEPHAAWLLSRITSLGLEKMESTVIQKLRVKIVQRIGLLFLKPKPQAWRYQRGARSLALTLTAAAPDSAATHPQPDQVDDEAYDIPEEVETVIEQLLSSLSHSEGVVRWSGAKGLGRIASRLPRELAEEVVTGIETALEGGAWHGGCLALAELGRRGALLPQQLPTLIPLLLKALVYEERGGRVSVGSAVRDAGCFLAWSFARTFRPEEMAPFVDDLAAGLLCVALLDRELHCRRAASAAFQENVGRQGAFPDGLAIIGECDYFALAHLHHCYTELVPFVAQFPTYRAPLSRALLSAKVPHWDPNVRRLAASALGLVTQKEPEWMVKMAIENLIPLALGRDLFGRQGSLFALGDIISSLLKLERKDLVSAALIEEVSKIPGEAMRRGLVKGLGAEWVRGGLNSLMTQLSRAPLWHLPTLHIFAEWKALLDENLHNTEKTIRDGAGEVWESLTGQLERLDPDGKYREALVKEYVGEVERGSVEVDRQAGAIWLGAVPFQSLKWVSVLDERWGQVLSQVSVPTGEADKSWAEGRQDALTALSSLFRPLRDQGGATSEQSRLVFRALIAACDDYTIDTRGDIGKVVRETAMTGLKLFFIRSPNGPVKSLSSATGLSPDELATMLAQAAGKIIQQTCEKIDQTRLVTTPECMYQVLFYTDEDILKKLPEVSLLQNVFLTAKQRNILKSGGKYVLAFDVKWMSASESFPRLAKLLDSPTYRAWALLGLVVSAGGLTESTMKAASDVLLAHAEARASAGLPALSAFLHSLTLMLQENVGRERIVGPMMVVLEKLLSSGSLEPLAEVADTEPGLLALLCLCIKVTALKKSPAKVLAGVGVACGFLQFHPDSDMVRVAKVHLIRTLGHVYPRVRRATAVQFYEGLLTYGDLDNHSELVLQLLLNTDWDREIAELKEVRLEIAARLNLPQPLPPVPLPIPLPPLPNQSPYSNPTPL